MTSLGIVILMLCLATGAGAAKVAADIFREAQLQENTVRDLDAAAQFYTDFLKQSGTDRSLQAQAYLHLGLCQAKMGKTEQAKTAWKKIVQDFSDQTGSYSEALSQLQQLQIAERSEVRPSSPIIHVVYEPPPARWMVEFPRATFLHTLDAKGRLFTTASGGSIGLTLFPQPNLGVTWEVGGLGSYAPPSAHRSIGYFSMHVRAEKPLANAITGFAKFGPGLYLFNFENNQKKESKLSVGLSGEAGLVLGLPRGFTFEFGYLLHLVFQATPSADFVSSIPVQDRPGAAEITQNRGLRLAGGPTVALSYRW